MTTLPPLRFGIYYDFRNPPAWKQDSTELYNGIFDQIAWAEDHGFDNVWISEHHFSEDGYAPSLFVIAAAIAARTRRIRIGTAVALLPLYHPVRLAEDAAMVDVISGGRFDLGVGAGYNVDEFSGFGIDRDERTGRMEEGLEIVRRLFDGERVDFHGKYFDVEGASLIPAPVQSPPPLWVGGFTPAAMRRAAAFGSGYVGQSTTREQYEQFVAARRKLGKPTTDVPIASGLNWLIPSEDPDKTWEEIAPHVLYQYLSYSDWVRRSGDFDLLPEIHDAQQIRDLGIVNVVDVDTCVKMLRDLREQVPMTHYYSFFLPPGMSPDWAKPHLELFANEVIPAFR